MRFSLPLLVAAAIVALPLTASPSLANKAAAEACAARLPPHAKMIFAATIGSVRPGVNLADVIRAKTRPLVTSGKISRSEAQGAAQAAGQCLKLAM